MVLKVLQKDVINLEATKYQLEAKLLKVDTDAIRYEEAHREHNVTRSFIVNIKTSLDS
jgi:hypothetical protein